MIGALRDGIQHPPDEEAVEAVEELLPEGPEFVTYLGRFMTLIVLSSGIAAFGLLADSSAVVIGAMLVAPLMTPITAAAAATVMARNYRLVRSLWVILLGVLGAIGVGWLSAVLGGHGLSEATELPGELEARTFPGLLDLAIAVTAGAAAGFIVPRRSATAALPGVGIAVALVPPLATVGIMLELGLGEEAANALLLFGTNLAAIVFSASVMLILAGFRPEEIIGRANLARRIGLTVLAVAIVAVPLAHHTRLSLEDASLSGSVADAVQEWDEDARIIELEANAGSGGDVARVELLVSGPNEPRPAWILAEEIESRFEKPIDLRLNYQRNVQFEVSTR